MPKMSKKANKVSAKASGKKLSVKKHNAVFGRGARSMR